MSDSPTSPLLLGQDLQHATIAFVLATLANGEFLESLASFWLSNTALAVPAEQRLAALLTQIATHPLDLHVSSTVVVPSERAGMEATTVTSVSFTGAQRDAFTDEFLLEARNGPALAALSVILHPTHQAFGDVDATAVLNLCRRRRFLYNGLVRQYARVDSMLLAVFACFLRVSATLKLDASILTRVLAAVIQQISTRNLLAVTAITAFGPPEDTNRLQRQRVVAALTTIETVSHTLVDTCARLEYQPGNAIVAADEFWNMHRETLAQAAAAASTRLQATI